MIEPPRSPARVEAACRAAGLTLAFDPERPRAPQEERMRARVLHTATARIEYRVPPDEYDVEAALDKMRAAEAERGWKPDPPAERGEWKPPGWFKDEMEKMPPVSLPALLHASRTTDTGPAAHKADTGKLRVDLVPHEGILLAAEAFGYGAVKYGDWNYCIGEGLAWSRIYAALLRHLFAWWGGEEMDPESRLPHLAHVLACSMMLAVLTGHEEHRGGDDRRR